MLVEGIKNSVSTKCHDLGGFGQVYDCKHKPSGQLRAVKLISKEGFTDQMRLDFIHETDILKRLAHQNIITVYEMYEDEA